MPPKIAQAVSRQAPVEVIPLRDWHGGRYLHEADPRLLAIAWEEKLTIVTYDVNSFPLHVKTRLEHGLSHAGVVYVTHRYRQNQIGDIARGLIKLWSKASNADWTNRIEFIS